MNVQAHFEKTFEGWRTQAREFLMRDQPPNSIQWTDEPSLLFDFVQPSENKKLKNKLTVPPAFLNMAQSVAYARDDDRWDLLYRILFRLQHENPNLLNIFIDADIARALDLEKSVRRDIHKMHAFVRFKEVIVNGQTVYMAWHRPEHLTLRPGTPFFVRRFGDKPWSIFTPDESAHWDLKDLSFGAGLPQHDFQHQDNWDDIWKTYYKSIFNPARIKIKAMKAEMAPKYWAALPESAVIYDLLREAPQRLQKMAANHNEAAQVNLDHTLDELREDAKSCTACPLYKSATQTVFGVGSANAKIMIVGEQPGDQEDLAGIPFVGPAGEILNDALKSIGISRDQIYFTNAVKHFKFVRADGKMRIHKKANGAEMHACRPWLEAEIQKIKPEVIIALGATAGTAILGRLPKITEERGKIIRNSKLAPKIILSWHPAAILRAGSPQEIDARKKQLRDDLAIAIYNENPVSTFFT